MKLKSKLAMLGLLCATAFPASADSIDDLLQYFQYFGSYLGYDVTKAPNSKTYNVSYTLLNAALAQSTQLYAVATLLGAATVSTFNDSAFASFMPNEALPAAEGLNNYANYTFIRQEYNSPSEKNVSVNANIDQQTYQKDPVSQSILNILSTPDSSYCMNSDGTTWKSGTSNLPPRGNCDFLTESQVASNMVGALPDANILFGSEYAQQYLGQLNSNSLIAPLMYSDKTGTKLPPNPANDAKSNPGLVSKTQAQQAGDFIRYVTGSVTPIPLPVFNDYNAVYTQAMNTKDTSATGVAQQKQAYSILTNYLASLRTYAAQSSVGIGNLYYILSKRLPQRSVDQSSTGLSQALAEFNMATWRIYNANSNSTSTDTQWINQLQNSSPATVEKEIAVLLAEINYQMYLDRQIQERILLTNSIMLIQNTRNAQPSANFSSSIKSTSSSNTQ